jgi:hypothetical protein
MCACTTKVYSVSFDYWKMERSFGLFIWLATGKFEINNPKDRSIFQ